MHDWDNIRKFTLECRVEICAALDGGKAITVGQLGEYADVAAVFELETCVGEM